MKGRRYPLGLQTFYKKFPYTLVNNNERHYQAVLYTILLILGCDVTPEVPTSDGRIDMVLKTAGASMTGRWRLWLRSPIPLGDDNRKKGAYLTACPFH